MGEAQEQTTFSVVFDGRLVAGRNAIDVERAFASKFGEQVAQRVFGRSPVTLKKGITRDQAVKLQEVLHKIGMTVQMIPTAPDTSQLSLVEPAAKAPAETAPTPSAPEIAAREPAQSESAQSELSKSEPPAPGELPQRGSSAPPASGAGNTWTTQDIDKAFADAIEIPPASRSYLVRLIPVTVLMLLLPVIYLGITALSGYGVFWMVTTGADWFFNTGLTPFLQLVGFLASLFASGLLTLFLLRPIVAKSGRPPEPVRLDPLREPVLFHLVERITETIGAPMPDEILVDTDVNASARLTNGLFSRELTLTIGLPLIYGASAQTVAGILAHEFGHFTQRWGMRASYLVHWINYWFHRQIHERDNWDRFVDQMLERDFIVLNLTAMLAQLGSFLVRLLLFALSYLASLFSFSLNRQMEFDADRYEIALIGSKDYENTAATLRVLGAGYQVAVSDLDLAFDSDKLVDNLPKLVALKTSKFSKMDRQRIAASIDEINTSAFDTHPADKERIRKAEEADLAARFVLPGPASKLLRDLERISKLATLQWYRSFGFSVAPNDLIPLDEFASETESLERAAKARSEYFGTLDEVPEHLPLLKPADLEALAEDRLAGGIQAARSKLAAQENDFLTACKQLDLQLEYQHYYGHALFWRRAGFDIDLHAYRLELTTKDPDEIVRKIAEFKEAEGKHRAVVRTCAGLQAQRLSCGLELAARRGQIEREELAELRRAYTGLAAASSDFDLLHTSNAQLERLLQIISELPDDTRFERQLQSEARTNEGLQRRIRMSLNGLPDPLTGADSLSAVLPSLDSQTGPSLPSKTLEDGERMLRLLGRTRFRLEGRLTEVALAAEGPA